MKLTQRAIKKPRLKRADTVEKILYWYEIVEKFQNNAETKKLSLGLM
jgi:hypothetical protein